MLYVIFNPHAQKGHAAQREQSVRTALHNADLSFKLARTEYPGHAQHLAAAAADQDHYTAIVAVGGDGTINEVVNGLIGSSLPLGLIPIGTGNDLVKMLELPSNRPLVAAERLRRGALRPVDVGVANGRAFINGLGCGFDAQVAVENQRPTRLRGFAVYLAALLRALKHYQSPPMRVCFDGQTIERRMLLTTVGNGRCHGGGFWVTPDARIDDGLFDLCLCDALRLDEIVRYIPKVIRGTHTRLKQVRMARAAHVTIESVTPVPVHVDGEILGTALQQVEVEIRPGALNLLA
ncbi:MAG TPA: diacylglycerol kinase family protein [Herpetosiphonaceae bacterium]